MGGIPKMPQSKHLLVDGFLLYFCLLQAGIAATNLAPNAGFEIKDALGPGPAEWTLWHMGHHDVMLTDEEAFDGKHSVKIVLPGLLDAAQGIAAKLAVEEKEKYSFSVKVKRGSGAFSPAQGGMKLIIEWHDEQGRVLQRSEGDELRLGSLSKYRWKELEISKVRAPRDVRYAFFGIHCWARGGRGVIYLDAAKITRHGGTGK